jgi:hypothetical protein
MNFRTGLIRLWIVFSALFALVVCVSSYSSIRRDFEASAKGPFYDALAKQYGGQLLLPVDCYKSRGTVTVDYSMDRGHCWYGIESFRRLYPEYADFADLDLANRAYSKAGLTVAAARPWKRVLQTASLAVGGPLAVLAFGWAAAWIAAGFRRQQMPSA